MPHGSKRFAGGGFGFAVYAGTNYISCNHGYNVATKMNSQFETVDRKLSRGLSIDMSRSPMTLSEIEAADRLEVLVELALQGQVITVIAADGQRVLLKLVSNNEAEYAI